MLYFAYGSNLCVSRLRARVFSASFEACGTVGGHELTWHKRSVDGSGKCSIARSRVSAVHGAVFQIPKGEKEILDQVEGLGQGYDEITVSVRTEEKLIEAVTYVAAESHIDDDLRPYSWYRDLVVAGAGTLGLPAEYVAVLRTVEALDDPDRERDRRNREALPCL
jgi:gamma-glutamylcyclotransferase